MSKLRFVNIVNICLIIFGLILLVNCSTGSDSSSSSGISVKSVNCGAMSSAANLCSIAITSSNNNPSTLTIQSATPNFLANIQQAGSSAGCVIGSAINFTGVFTCNVRVTCSNCSSPTTGAINIIFNGTNYPVNLSYSG